MGVLPIVLLILAMKIPIFGLIGLVWWAGRAPQPDDSGEMVREDPAPRRPDPWRRLRGPRRGGPHGGAAVAPARSRGPVRGGPVPARALKRYANLAPDERDQRLRLRRGP